MPSDGSYDLDTAPLLNRWKKKIHVLKIHKGPRTFPSKTVNGFRAVPQE